MIVALVGNPNCGKTTLFNQLTGSNQHVGNFPGVTVEHKYGDVAGYEGCRLVDLPGLYSLRPYSGEEIIARDFLLNNKPDAIINIADVTNPQRNLYLTLQLIELGIPMVLALNMMDELRDNHGSADAEKLSMRLGIPVVPISAAKNDGVAELMRVAVELAEKGQRPKRVFKGAETETDLAQLRYRYIEKVCNECIVQGRESAQQRRSEKIDRLLTNKYLAIPIFLGIMVLIFWMTFSVIGQRLSDLLSQGIDTITAAADATLSACGINPTVQSLVVDGIFAGVGSVLSFLPIIVVLFFFLAVLEDTGYMARIAFIMDKPLRGIGLSGKSFVPMLIGFGCSVPAIMATRTLSSERDRKMTLLMVPFMSCSAKIPVYAMFTAAFFPNKGVLVMSCLYIGGFLAGVIAAKILIITAFSGDSVPFIMELPNYRMPSVKSVLLLMWEKAWDFIRRAFTLIFVATVAVWFLQHFDASFNAVNSDSTGSLLAKAGMLLAPIFAPLGFGDWRIVTSLVTGLMAKEAVISSMGVLLNVGTDGLAAAISGLFTYPSALSFLTFCLLYTPCVAAMGAMKRELGSGLKAAGVVISQCCVAWLTAYVVYILAGVLL